MPAGPLFARYGTRQCRLTARGSVSELYVRILRRSRIASMVDALVLLPRDSSKH